MVAAIFGLQDYTGRCNKDHANHLIVVIETICEAIRFKYILNFIVSHYEEGEIPGDLIEDITVIWSHMRKFLIQIVNKMKIKTPITFTADHELTQEEVLHYVAVIKDYEAETGHGIIWKKKKWKGKGGQDNVIKV